MSKKSKSRAKQRRLTQKRNRKAAMKAQYEAWARSGQNKKSKRFKQRVKTEKKARMSSHAEGRCGNIGCMNCSHLYQPNGPLHYLKVARDEAYEKIQEVNTCAAKRLPLAI